LKRLGKALWVIQCLGALVLFLSSPVRSEEPVVWLDDLNLSLTGQEWGTAQPRRSVTGNPITLGGKAFSRGIGVHAFSQITIDLKGAAVRFQAIVGVDDEPSGRGMVSFRVLLDGLEKSVVGPIKYGDAPVPISIDVRGAGLMDLVVDDGGNGISGDHADWADARLILGPAATKRPEIFVMPVEPRIRIASGRNQTKPSINGPRVVGATPGFPFILRVPVSGTGPFRFSSRGLPKGVSLDAATGVLSGWLQEAGILETEISAHGKYGAASRSLIIVSANDALALTPPMGWNSWYAWGPAVDEGKVKEAADALIKTGLASHGYQYINVDEGWQGKRIAGKLTPNERFGNMKGLVDYIHSQGLKFGLYSSPGPRSCLGSEGSYGHEEEDAASFAGWGADYLKYDWCSYGEVWGSDSLTSAQRPYRVMKEALKKTDRDIVYSLCQYGSYDVWKWGNDVGGNLWRTTSDMEDSWTRMTLFGFRHSGLDPYAGPGHWNDPDVLMVGVMTGGTGTNPHVSRLTPNEQITHVTLWALLAAPIMVGSDLSQIDPFTVDLLTNDEILDVDQDPLGTPAKRVVQKGKVEIWSRPLYDGTLAVGLFNLDIAPAPILLEWKSLGLFGSQNVRDLWARKEVGTRVDSWQTRLVGHGAMMLKVGTPRQVSVKDIVRLRREKDARQARGEVNRNES
jgi:alpha-galactosidase